ncbi:MAG: 23S rRNA (guanosine(2251)-2'-O)-methyltransferase RlmB [Deltaproteobacteria bacterium]|nr:23S rRNA (guanosine(2251)-2'-O)-methyltransferase RlmB [Deltaproteobacteria bacterium]
MSERDDPAALRARAVVGIQPVREVLRVRGAEVARLFVERSESPRLAAVARFATDRGVPVEVVSRVRLDQLSRGVQHQGVVALAPDLPIVPLDQLMQPDAALVLLDGITDPHNFGAAIRSAVALGSGGVVFGANQAAPLSAATFRTSAGAIEHAELCRVPSLRGAVEALVAGGVTVVSLEADAEASLGDLDLTGPAAVVIGSEDKGVGRAVRKSCSARARLPMSGRLDSLNASVASAVALYEIRRQRGGTPPSRFEATDDEGS